MYIRHREPKVKSKDLDSEQYHSRSAEYKKQHEDQEKNGKEKFVEGK
ncbi:MAG: hypothetical protein ACERKV_05895 [Clostridiaceae bacterium]